MTTQIFVASTAFGLATLAAALADGLFEQADRRILLQTNNTAMPEGSPSLLDVAGASQLLDRFDSVFDYNEAIEPSHPAGWTARAADLPILERYFRLLWGIGSGAVQIIVESIQANPARTLCQIFGDAPIYVYADGLMAYGPTRSRLPATLGCRIERLFHLDLVPRVTPLLITEWEAPRVIISAASMRSVIDEMASRTNRRGSLADGRARQPSAMVVSQYLAANGLLTEREEVDLYGEMIRGSVAAGFGRVIFKAHPSIPAATLSGLVKTATREGVHLVSGNNLELAESVFARGEVDLVVGCFSTALATAKTLYGLPVVRHGTDLMLERLTPYQNSNRIPTTIVDAWLPDLRSLACTAHSTEPFPDAELNALVGAVGYVMQPELLPDRRNQAAQFLGENPAARARYVKRRRLTALSLPGSLAPTTTGKAMVRKLARPLAGLRIVRKRPGIRSGQPMFDHSMASRNRRFT